MSNYYHQYVSTGSFLGLDIWGVSNSGWGSGLVGLECANAQNSYSELLGGYQETNPEGVLYESWGVITPLRGCRKLPASAVLPFTVIAFNSRINSCRIVSRVA